MDAFEVIEGSKENIAPLKQGRTISSLVSAISAKKTDKEDLLKEQQQ
jgi:hypothetical protein